MNLTLMEIDKVLIKLENLLSLSKEIDESAKIVKESIIFYLCFVVVQYKLNNKLFG